MGVKIAGDFTGGSDEKRPAMSASTQLVELAEERYQFRLSDERQPYAVKPGRHVVRLLRGGQDSLRAELSQAFYRKHKKVPPQQALADAMLALEGLAQDQDPTPVHLRVAAAGGDLWLDLGDAAETVIRMSPGSWQIVQSGVPVQFRRTALTGVMPQPVVGGDLGLWDHLNVSPIYLPRKKISSYPSGMRECCGFCLFWAPVSLELFV